MIVAARQRLLASQERQSVLATAAKSISQTNTLPLRWHSSIEAKQCPYHGGGNNGSATSIDKVKLVNVPKLPFIGSIISQHSGMDKVDLSKSYDTWYNNHKSFGHFYSTGLPAVGKGLYNEVFVLTDPNEMMKVLRKEGPLPFGPLSIQWPLTEYYKDEKEAGTQGGSAGSGLMSNGPEWQKYRRFIQSDLLHPASAKGYASGIIKASQMASEGAPKHAKNVSEYMAYSSFDMFSSVAFGEFPGIATGKGKHEEDEKFCKSTLGGLGLILPLIKNPFELALKKIGIKTKLYSEFERNFGTAREIAHEKVKRFRKRKANDELQDDFEDNSYANLSIDRQLSAVGQEDALREDEAAEMIVVGLVAAVDTTSALLNWTITHLALNPDVQEELYKEISQNVANVGAGTLTVDCFGKSNNVYLDAVLRENHRMTPPIAFNLNKENVMDDVEIHGTIIPKGSMFMLDSRSVGMDPSFVKDPDVFDPSRWLKDAVESRHGTPAKILDHPL
mmetsp:Transcript_11169/g.23142  ORF Transcript_11169/g.23142 Transcript_11169/m.23142 type:complete len:503 (+) Transcript_11169:97-1605(+)